MKLTKLIKPAIGVLLVTVVFAITSVAKTPKTWSATGSLQTARFGFTPVLLKDGRVLVSGGMSENLVSVLSSAEVYDPVLGKWTATGSMITARAYHVATLLQDGRVLVAGGCTNTTCYDATGTAEIFDPATGVWQATGSMSIERYGFTVTVLQDGNVLVVGGCGLPSPCTSPERSTEIYVPASGVWSSSGNLLRGRDSHSATLLTDGRVLVAGGYSSNGTEPSVEMYDPVTAVWSTVPNMNNDHSGHSATLLLNGKVLVAAGMYGRADGRTGNTSELYDPAANNWTRAGLLNNDRCEQTAVRLRNGEVLVAGGVSFQRGKNAVVLDSAELFNPKFRKWLLTGKMTTPRDAHGMVLLSKGKVLAVGGIDKGVGGTVLASAEIYTP